MFSVHTKTKPAFKNSTGLKSVYEKLRFRDGLVWTVDLTGEIKLRFRDGLVWTVGLTGEIKLRFQSPVCMTSSGKDAFKQGEAILGLNLMACSRILHRT